MTFERVVIIGAGHAGGTAAALLRQMGFKGQVTLIGDEPVCPYQRPPLSKAWLKGEADSDSLLLRPESFYREQDIELVTGVAVRAIDREARMVRLDRSRSGAGVPYDALILATGSRARTLPVPGGDDPAVLTLRTMADADRLKARLTPGARLVLIGAGYVGLEAAASATALGCTATVVEVQDRVLSRTASPALAERIAARHGQAGVEILTGVGVAAIRPGGTGVELSDGRVLEADVVLVGVGAVAEDRLARDAGLTCRDGVVVNAEARTSDDDIFAIGDCAWRPWPLYGSAGRLESVPSALETAKQAAAAISGAPPPPPEVPWFWSDQYDLKLQVAGLFIDADRQVIRRDAATDRFAVFHLKGDRLRAVEALNAPQEFMGGRLLIASGKPVDDALLADPTVSMKAVTKA
ncbi:FAD-dependent oxidoreductase [Brevundimonas sp. 2R-24]|uniref:FAD-dependent oxidoreductase n=1 Tax=Peiella sedimenti TaxID=3061083 RepID=A0ABT8SNN1_9CAUL|nr:FAD-dependent oxidoreductase [Caulobacteraceae bacterium XZ-24]